MSPAKSTVVAGGFLALTQGAYVSYKDRPAKIRRVLSLESVVIQYVEGGETERVQPADLRPIEYARLPATSSAAKATSGDTAFEVAVARDISDFTEAEWHEAMRVYEIIEPLLQKSKRTRADVEGVASQHGVQVSTIYRWLKDYSSSGHISGLVKGKRGRKLGTRLLLPEQEAIIEEKLEQYLDPQAITPATVIADINNACEAANVPRMHPNTIRNRIADIPLKRRLTSRGNKDLALQLFEARPGEFPDGKFPLETIQIDHVKLDFKVVDSKTRQAIEKRPWLTLAIDCYSRMIVGYFLSLMPPSAFAAGVCLYMAMMPKQPLLAKLDLPGRWPVYGKFRRVHSDNAKEFKGALLQRACDEHNIDLTLRRRKTPRYGAYIERMVGNVNRELHKKPGTTHQSPGISPDYDSSKKAAFTLDVLECEIVDWIVNYYHVNVHSALSGTPLHLWEAGLLGDRDRPGVGLPPLPLDPEKLRLDFLPFETRGVHPYGVEIGRLYYHEVLNKWINAADPDDPKKKRKFIFRYDPRTIRRIWFWDPEVKQYFEIPIRDTTWPDISWAEYDEHRKTLARQGETQVDEQAIKGYVQRSKERERSQIALTESVRKAKKKEGRQSIGFRVTDVAPGAEQFAATPTSQRPAPLPRRDDIQDDSLFAKPVEAFQDIDL